MELDFLPNVKNWIDCESVHDIQVNKLQIFSLSNTHWHNLKILVIQRTPADGIRVNLEEGKVHVLKLKNSIDF